MIKGLQIPCLDIVRNMRDWLQTLSNNGTGNNLWKFGGLHVANIVHRRMLLKRVASFTVEGGAAVVFIYLFIYVANLGNHM